MLGDKNHCCWRKLYHIKEAFRIHPITHGVLTAFAVVCCVIGSICLINASPALSCFGVHLLIATLALNNTWVQREQVMEKENNLNPRLVHLVFTYPAIQKCPYPPQHSCGWFPDSSSVNRGSRWALALVWKCVCGLMIISEHQTMTELQHDALN